jgi:hypothetical protein
MSEVELIMFLSLSDRPGGHLHLPWGVEQVGWLGQTGRVYRLDEEPQLTESGSFMPLYIARGEICGHVLKSQEEGAA